jgi:4-amino-4-deoxy-L-arabinose transferase-like glycosyltransferase
MKRYLVLLSLLIHLAIFVLFPAAQRVNQTPDYLEHYEIGARNLLAGNGYLNTRNELITRYPPGFSLVLVPVFAVTAATGLAEQRGLDFLIAGCGIAATVLLFLLAELLFSRRVALLAAVLWTTYPFYLYLTKQPNPESPFLVCILGSVYGWARVVSGHGWRWAVVAGMAAGCGTLIRPINLFEPFLLAVTLLLAGPVRELRCRMVPAAVLLVASVLPLLPWEIHVFERTGQWILVSSNSSHSTFDGLTFALEAKASGQRLEVDPDVRWLMEQVWEHRFELSTTGSMIRFVADRYPERPGAVIKLLLLKAGRSWHGTQAQWYEQAIAAIQIPYLLLVVVGIWVCWSRFPARRRDYIPLILLTTGYLWAMSILVLPILRYMVPAISLLLVPAAALLERFLPRRIA